MLLGMRAALLQSTALTSPVFTVNFLTTDSLPAEMTLTRAGHATYFDSTGKLTYAPNNELLYSNTFSDASWVKTFVASVTQNATDYLGNANTAWTMEPITSTNAIRQQYGTVLPVGQRVHSAYVKAGTASWAYLRVWEDSGLVNAGYISFNLSNGTVGSNTASAGVSPVANGTITSVGNGWYRISVTTATTVYRFGVGFADADATIDCTGSKNGYLSYCQLEQVTYQTTPRTYNATTSAAYYGPRIEYDPVALTRQGLLSEWGTTNKLFPSIPAATLETWPDGSGTITLNNVAGPDGLTNMARFLEDTDTSGHGVYQQALPIAVSSGVTHCYSTYVKGIGRTKIRLTFGDGSITNGGYAEFDLSNGTVLTQATAFGTGSVTANGAKITDVGGGIYRISLGGKVPATTAFLVVNSLDDSGNYSFVGDVTKGFYWGYSQCENGTYWPTSYIPTTTAAVTRATDIAVVAKAGLTANYTQLIQAEWSVGGEEYMNATTDALADSSETYQSNATNLVGYAYKDAGGSSILTAIPGIARGAVFTAVQGFGAAIQKFAVNGSYQEQALTGPVRVPTKFWIANYEGLTAYSPMRTHIRKVSVYDQTLTQDEITSLSNG